MLPGTRLGPYQISDPLGAGGMGEVYRATDTRLKRQVAVKILPPALSGDQDRLARFQREAEVLASLNHPNIAAVYGLEETDGVKALVMELVGGPTLADRIAQGAIPIDEAFPIARQIAAALEAAHERGIIHRDLKPANIKVRDDGTVKVLDFGLAKLTQPEGVGSRDDPSQSPTLTSPAAMTGMGMILGTAAYMSPEQARGRAVDKRTDVWAFGAVLYEMLTGARAFEGEDITEVMASVVKSTPNWGALPADVPPQVVTLIQRCLEKDRNARIGDIAVARFLLDGHATLGTSPAGAAHAATARWHRTMPLILVVLFAGAVLGWLLSRRQAAGLPITHLQMSVAPADQLVGSIASVRPSRTAMAISPDGRLVVFSGVRGNAAQLYIRALDRGEATPVPGTEGGIAPFFSPDGQWIGFWVANTIKKVPVAGGPVATVANVSGPGWGASWAEDGTIFFASPTGIARVSHAGGTPAAVTTVDATTRERHRLPHVLPGGKALVLTSFVPNNWESANVALVSLDTGERRVLIQGGADARYVSTGHLVYMKTGTLTAVPFDIRSQQVTGPAVTLVEGVMQGISAPNTADETGAGQFTVSPTGTLVYATGGINPLLETSWVWVDRNGAAEPVSTVPAGPYLFPRLSPDGQKVAVTRRVANRTSDLWVYDLARGAPTRLTFDGSNSWPVWSPDGKRLVYGASTTGPANLYAIHADGAGKPERLTTSDWQQIPSSWEPATNAVAFLQRPEFGMTAIWVLGMAGDTAEGRQPKLLLESRFNLMHPEFAPDGRWIAYVSNESGALEVYVQAYPGPGEKIRVSTAGGTEPIWNANGRELLYRATTGPAFFSATIRSLSPFRVDPPRELFVARSGEYDSTSPIRSWTISADGQRFLLSRYAESKDRPVSAMHVVLNWAEELKRLVPAR